MDMVTTRQAAAKLKRSIRSVNEVAKAHAVGTMLTERQRLFTAAEVERLRALFKDRAKRDPRKQKPRKPKRVKA